MHQSNKNLDGWLHAVVVHVHFKCWLHIILMCNKDSSFGQAPKVGSIKEVPGYTRHCLITLSALNLICENDWSFGHAPKVDCIKENPGPVWSHNHLLHVMGWLELRFYSNPAWTWQTAWWLRSVSLVGAGLWQCVRWWWLAWWMSSVWWCVRPAGSGWAWQHHRHSQCPSACPTSSPWQGFCFRILTPFFSVPLPNH